MVLSFYGSGAVGVQCSAGWHHASLTYDLTCLIQSFCVEQMKL
jgi:hypothetical protein